jgi:hypothetical protein
MVLGLLLQVIALALTHVTIKGRWLQHTGALLLLMACVYHGFTELEQLAFPGRNPVRAAQLNQQQLDGWMVLVSLALLAFAVTYAIAMRGRPAPRDEALKVAVLDGLQVKWLLLLSAPLIYLSAEGAGAVQAAGIGADQDRSNYATGGLALQFLVFMCALTGVVVITRFGGRWLLPVLAVQSALLAFVGVRSMIVVSAALVLYGAARLGVRYSVKMLAAAAIVIGLLAFSISSARAIHGREVFLANETASTRLSALSDGFFAMGTLASREAILNDIVYRFDANVFGPLVVESLDSGTAPTGVQTIENNVWLTVPSFLNPGKLTTDVTKRNEDAFFRIHFGLNYRTDYLPGLWGFLVGYFGKGAFFILSALLGAAFAGVDRWLARASTQNRFLISFGLAQSVFLYEQLPAGFFINGRGVLLFAAMMAGLGLLRRAGRRQTAPVQSPHPARAVRR